ncbi:LysR family transcriptional regulator YeiE [Lachnospiraceae bacterium KM106-2]|nr:LysR family transcriptional regulator YeiE [Lachnospiraceae bacterium KM106-2]
MLDYRIETFLTLCRKRNYSKAAKELCISQPAVTQHIQYLERFYDCKLFYYENKSLMLTKQGALLERLLLGLSASDKRIYERVQLSKQQKRYLNIGASLPIAEFIMPEVMDKLMDLVVEMKIRLGVNNTDELLNGLQKDYYNCLFIEGYFEKEKYSHELLSKEEVILVAGKEYQPSQLEGLLSEVLIIKQEGSGIRKMIDGVLSDRNLTVNSYQNVMEVENLSIIKKLVESGKGISFVYRLSVEKELEEKRLFEIPLDIKMEQEFNFVILQNNIFAKDYLELFYFVKEIYDKRKSK